jgi:heat shock protein HtpX
MREDAFRLDVGLRIRMSVAVLLSAVLLVAGLAFAVWVVSEGGWAIVAMFLLIAAAGLHKPGRIRGANARPELRQRAEHAVSRLSLVADLTEPETVVKRNEAPLSWTTAVPFRRPRVHFTTGLLERLKDRELEAVAAHELSHLGNRDAVIMTVLAAPGLLVLRGFRETWHEEDSGLRVKAGLVMFGCIYVPPALVFAGLARMVSRHREIAADRGAALLTGSPAALASALRKLSDGLHAIPDRDLRAAAAADVLNVVPARPAHGIARLWATHPPLEDRIERLERLEARLQA